MSARATTREDLEQLDPGLAELIQLLPEYDPWDLAQPGMYFDVEAAWAAIEFFPRWFRLIGGPKSGEPFVLVPWQAAVTANLFGWKRPGGTRRYRRVFIYVGKKNAKSSFSAGLVLLVMCADGEKGAQIYSIAAGQKQTRHVFDHAAGFVAQCPELRSKLRVYGFKGGTVAKSIVYPDMLSSYRCLAADADTEDGFEPHMAIVDELHRHRSGELADLAWRSASTRRQPLVIYTTTADYNRESVCNRMRQYALTVRDNDGDPDRPGHDPAYLPAIWEASMEDDWGARETWLKANPGLGVIKSEEIMADAYREAMEDEATLNQFLRLDLNIITDADVAWIPLHEWDQCQGPETFHEMVESLEGQRCFGGLDLAKTTDLTAFALYFPDTHSLLLWFWLPKEPALAQQKREPKRLLYSTWSRGRYLELTDGDVCDYEVVRDRILQLARKYNIQDVGYDPHECTEMAQNLQAAGLKVIEMRQGPPTLNEGCKELARLWKSKKLKHGGHPVLRWNASNTMVRTNANLGIAPDKQKSTGQIDGISAAVMAIGRAAAAGPPPVSVYETRGPVVL